MAFIDAFDLDPGNDLLRDVDVCVIGSGPAGLTVAMDLARRGGCRAVVLEAGDRACSVESQRLYRGENVGDRYYDLDACRLRCFGGTSNHWGGWCRELDAHDFYAKSHVPYSGWPISKSDLDPFQADSYRILEVDTPFDDRVIRGATGEVLDARWRFTRAVNFAHKFGKTVDRSDRLDLIVNACVVDFDARAGWGSVRAARFRTINPESPVFEIEARLFVLACGGIENARVLLNANGARESGPGNQNDLVGRFFMEHPHYRIGEYVDFSGWFGREENVLKVTEDFVYKKRTLNCSFRFVPFANETMEPGPARDTRDAFCRAAPALAEAVLKRLGTQCVFGEVRAMSEQAPNPDSRVILSDQADELGMRIVRLDWRKLPIDKHVIRESALALGRTFASADLGRIRLDDWARSDALDSEHDPQMGGNHHMGTTRMGATPRTGVVDPDCRVFGTGNLYVAGSSVFTTGGCANPTLTIVQLALRLGKHLHARLTA